MCLLLLLCMYVYMFMCMYVCACVRPCMCVHMYILVYVCVLDFTSWCMVIKALSVSSLGWHLLYFYLWYIIFSNSSYSEWLWAYLRKLEYCMKWFDQILLWNIYYYFQAISRIRFRAPALTCLVLPVVPISAQLQSFCGTVQLSCICATHCSFWLGLYYVACFLVLQCVI